MLSSRITLIASLALILFIALVLSTLEGCSGANAMPLPTAMVQNVAPMPTATQLASPTDIDVPAPAFVTATPPTIGSDFQAMDGSRFDVREGFSFVPPKGWYYIGRWEFPFETQYVFSTLAAEHNAVPGQLNLVVRVVPNTRPDDWISLRVSEKEMLRRLTRQLAGFGALQVDFDQNHDPRPIELAAGTFLVIPDGSNLITFSAFGNTWNDYASYAAQVEGIFQSIRLEHVPPTPTVDLTGKGASPTPDGKPASTARATLERFMQARIDRDEPGILDLLTEQLQAKVMRGLAVDVPLTQVSNPCWYRYLVLTFNQASEAQAQARVRVYEHQWPGDNAGSLPRSWEQEIGLAETTAGWRVDELGEAENEHQEPNEPHGPTLSACTAWRQTPANANPTLTPASTSNLRLAKIRQETSYAIFVPTKIPDGLVPDSPVRSDPPNDNVQIRFRDASGSVALLILNGPAGCCLDADSRKVGERVMLPKEITAHLLEYIQPEYGGPILWWIQDQTYVALSSPTLSKEELIEIATSMSRSADLP